MNLYFFDKIIKTVAVFFVVLPCMVHAGIYCKQQDGGWYPADRDSGVEYRRRSTVYFEYQSCLDAIRGLKVSSQFVCGPFGSGSSLFHKQTGEVVAGNTGYYFDVKHCSIAARNQSDGVVCVPGGSGSRLFDTKYDRYVSGTAFWYDVAHCSWASYSARHTDDFVCEAKDGWTTVYSRQTNEPIEGQPFFGDVENCYRYLRGP